MKKMWAGVFLLSGVAVFVWNSTGRSAGPGGDDRKTPFPRERETRMEHAGKTEIAIMAGGCFWGVEELIRKLPGVLDTTVGYTGGTTPNPVYEQVKKGDTGHAEAIQVTFDPDKLQYADLLRYFFRLHDPTTRNRQGNDIGTQYRSAIFFTTSEQEQVARKVKQEVDSSGKWNDPVVTEIVAASEFHPAEEYHQDYLQKVPNGYTCHYLRD